MVGIYLSTEVLVNEALILNCNDVAPISPYK